MAEVKVTEGNLNNPDNLGGSDVSVKITGGGKSGLANVVPQAGVPMDEKTSSSILANMEKLASEINNPWRRFNEGLKDVSAWTAYNKGPAFALREEAAAADRNALYNIRQQQAALQAAQAQAQADAADYAAKMGGAGGAGMSYSGIPVPESVQARLGRNAAQNKAILDDWLKTRTTKFIEAETNPASLARQPVVIWDPIENKPVVRDVNMFEYQDLKAKGLIKQPSEYYESKAAPTSVSTAPQSGEVLPRLKSAVFSTESSSGKADTSKPSVQGAIGPMQITPDTFETAKRLKLIPAEYDINNPAQNKIAGEQLIEYYYNKYDKNADKALAAYIGGEGAINKDGTINLDRKDALGTSIGQYIAMNKAKAGLAGDLAKREPGVQVASTDRGFPDVSKIAAERKAAEEEQFAAAKKRGESGEAMRTSFENDIDPGTLSDNYATSRRIQTLVKNDPTITGVLTGPGYAKAVGGILEKGIGNFGIADLDEAIFKTLPTTTNMSAADRKELSTYLAKIELQAAKLIKGQGQITEGEREILQRASSSIKDPAELIYKKARVLERVTKMNEELAAIYGDGEKYSNFRKFKNEPEFKRIHAAFRGDLENILNEKTDFTRPKVGTAPKVNHPEDIQNIINKNKPKAP